MVSFSDFAETLPSGTSRGTMFGAMKDFLIACSFDFTRTPVRGLCLIVPKLQISLNSSGRSTFSELKDPDLGKVKGLPPEESIYIFFISFDSSGDMLRNPEVCLSLTSTFSSLLF
ncbi:hypothetical protein V8G54_033982 [Vigna mungo]|uniref:Uncharacterized protein n=1 Tax=Vigna mungo TaxID=3915 RepID=A0AAQ3MQC4_VIGMU